MTALLNSAGTGNGLETTDRTEDRRPSGRRGRRLGALAAALVFVAVLLPSLGEALMWPVQSRFARANLEDGREVAGFIALGGELYRFDEAVALGHRHPAAKIVVTGEDGLPAGFFAENGIAADRLLIEPAATNTYENAINTAKLLGPNRSLRWILVTSAYHMPRAIGSFRKAGVAVEAWPVPDPPKDWQERLAKATHEWVGLLAYWLDGRTDALFPAPKSGAATATAAIDHSAARATQ